MGMDMRIYFENPMTVGMGVGMNFENKYKYEYGYTRFESVPRSFLLLVWNDTNSTALNEGLDIKTID